MLLIRTIIYTNQNQTTQNGIKETPTDVNYQTRRNRNANYSTWPTTAARGKYCRT